MTACSALRFLMAPLRLSLCFFHRFLLAALLRLLRFLRSSLFGGLLFDDRHFRRRRRRGHGNRFWHRRRLRHRVRQRRGMDSAVSRAWRIVRRNAERSRGWAAVVAVIIFRHG